MRGIIISLLLAVALFTQNASADGRAFPPDNCSITSPFMAFTAVDGSNTYCNSGQDVFLNALPNCLADQQVTFDGAQFICKAAPTLPACGANEVLSSNGTQFVCVTNNNSSNNASSGGSVHGFQDFPEGNHSFTVPAGVTNLKVTIVGGGGGGAAYGTSGGAGAKTIAYVNGLTPGTAIPVTVGAAGFPATHVSSPGTPGGTSIFGSYITATGGTAGRPCPGCSGVSGTLTAAPGVILRAYMPATAVFIPALDYGSPGTGGDYDVPTRGYVGIEW